MGTIFIRNGITPLSRDQLKDVQFIFRQFLSQSNHQTFNPNYSKRLYEHCKQCLGKASPTLEECKGVIGLVSPQYQINDYVITNLALAARLASDEAG